MGHVTYGVVNTPYLTYQQIQEVKEKLGLSYRFHNGAMIYKLNQEQKRYLPGEVYEILQHEWKYDVYIQPSIYKSECTEFVVSSEARAEQISALFDGFKPIQVTHDLDGFDWVPKEE